MESNLEKEKRMLADNFNFLKVNNRWIQRIIKPVHSI